MSVSRKNCTAAVFIAILAAAVSSMLIVPSNTRLRKAQNAELSLATEEDGLLSRAQALEIAKFAKGDLPPDLTWSGPDDASVEVAQQQVLVDLANASGLQALSFGTSQPPENINSPTKAYEIEIEGGHSEMARFLAGIDQTKPRLAISYLWIRQIPVSDGQTVAPINMRLTVWGFREGKAPEK